MIKSALDRRTDAVTVADERDIETSVLGDVEQRFDGIARSGKPVETLSIREVGGARNTVDAGVEIVTTAIDGERRYGRRLRRRIDES